MERSVTEVPRFSDAALIDNWPSCLVDGPKFLELAVEERLCVAAAVTIIETGAARTSTIAKHARISESTMFRYVHKADVIVKAVNWAWTYVNTAIAEANFNTPGPREPVPAVLADFKVVLRLFEDDMGRLATTLAFWQLRRPRVFAQAGQPDKTSAQVKYFSRLESLCTSVVGDEPGQSEAMATFIANYAAAAWFSWLADSDARSRPDYLLGIDYVVGGLCERLVAAETVVAGLQAQEAN